MIGKPGCGIYQMNGQPTAQNTRETGADGDLPGFRNWDNPEHIKQLADLWNVDPMIIPHWAPPTHAMQIWRYAEQGSIKLLWISGTNPAVSLPELARIREICQQEGLFLVVQDGFLTETAQFADVVLPAAIWGEKTGTFTNVDRTVHISDKAVDPPGEARSDLDIWLDYARRMDFRDLDGSPLIQWHDPETAFEAWKQCSRGRPCDYTGMTYGKLRGGSGIQWPCTAEAPDGTERLYTDGSFNTDPDYCETYGHDLATGAENEPTEYKAKQPNGRAFLHGADYQPPHEEPDADYPLSFTTGRTIYHWHTRTSTARTPQLEHAAPSVWVEICPRGRRRRWASIEGDLVRVESRRGYMDAPVRVSDIRPGLVFAPFHYGYFDSPTATRPAAHPSRRQRADPDRMGPGLQAALLQVRRRPRRPSSTTPPATPPPPRPRPHPRRRRRPPRGRRSRSRQPAAPKAESESTMQEG